MRSLSILFVLVMSTAAQATNWDVIDPIGNEFLGNLVVTAPSTATVPAKSILLYALSTGGPSSKVVSPDKPQRILGGTYCVILKHQTVGTTSEICDVKVVKKQTTTIGVSAIRFDWDQTKFQVGVGPTVILVSRGDRGFTAEGDATERWMNVDKTMYAPLFDTRVTVRADGFAVFPPVTVNVAQGQVEAHALALPERRSSIEVKFPTRAFPDPSGCSAPATFVHRTAPTGNVRFHSPYRVMVGSTQDQTGTYNLVNFANITDTNASVRYFASKDGLTPLFYEFVVNNTFVPVLSTSPGVTQIVVKRIDVNDVFVTRENGTTYYAKGLYQILRKDAATGAWKILEVPLGRLGGCQHVQAYTQFATKTGLDVLPGEYKVLVDYRTEEGAEQKEFYVDLR